MKIEAHSPLTPKRYDEYEQLEAAVAAALRNGSLPDPQVVINEKPGVVWIEDDDD